MTADIGRLVTGAAATQAPTIWFEVEDLITHFRSRPCPTGIQRVMLELLEIAERRASTRFRACRLHPQTGRLEALDWPMLHAMIGRAQAELAAKRLGTRLNRHVGYALRDLLALRPANRRDRHGHPERAALFECAAREHDIVLALGTCWTNAGHGRAIAQAKSRHGLRLALLLHDLIPIRHADVVPARSAAPFRRWLEDIAPATDLFLTPSRAVRNDLKAHIGAYGWPTRPIEVLRFGSGFSTRAAAARPVPVTEPFVLHVGSIDARKNISLLVEVWRRLAGPGERPVPTLLLAGQRGWKAEETLDDLRRDGFVGGKVKVIEDIGDGELTDLYARAHFTVFPSLAEGWGLPVEESLVNGKLCVCSNATSIPEVGGDLVDYFDPRDIGSATAAIERVLYAPGHLEARQAEIRERFRPASWQSCFDGLVAQIDMHLSGRFGTAQEFATAHH